MKEKRGSFSGGLGFVLAAAGSAVGLGNLWRFPYLAAQYGGGIFIFVYLILVLTFGYSMLVMEIGIGRKTKKSAISAFKQLDKKFSIFGYLAMIVPMIILPYYCVIGGWVLKYMMVFLSGKGTASAAAADGYFGEFISATWTPLIMFLIFFAITIVVVLAGVEKGVERVSKLMMPILILISIGICIYVVTIEGAIEGIKYYLLPDFSKFSFKTVCGAMGQMFYSMSLAMGIMISYGSYVKDDVNIGKSVGRIEIFDTGIAIMAGFMIIPVVYVFSGEAGLTTGGPGLMFKTLPKVFDTMPMGTAIGAAFFILVLFAALTSSISIMEAIVSNLMDAFKITRKKAVVIIIAISLVLGVITSLGNGVLESIKILGMGMLDFFDYFANSVLMPIVALGTCIMIGWRVGTNVIEEEVTKNGDKMGRVRVFRIMVKYIAPVCMMIILIFYSLVQFKVIEL
ncbi:MAG: sodium-dependent transporter [Lachnospiraceae bacterium]|nr:sodium-dependent transporter [Lachnospiraceae bacterium]